MAKALTNKEANDKYCIKSEDRDKRSLFALRQ